MNNNIYIPDRFKKPVILHIIKNHMTQGVGAVPLILGIHGPSGTGKTFQCEHTLGEMGVQSFLISGGQLESKDAGEPAALIRDMYRKASYAIESKRANAAAVVINDIDTGIGNWGGLYQYTVNQQNVFGELMHLVDFPTMVENARTRRIPIIVTGNDFTKLYQPLVRAGRMNAFAWEPNTEEKEAIIIHIFPELQSKQCHALVNEFSKEPLSFFSTLRSMLIDEDLYREIQQIGTSKMLGLINEGREPLIRSAISFEKVVHFGRYLTQSGNFVNHLRRM